MRGLNQKATYWGGGGSDGFGNRVYVAPIIINTRWEAKQVLFVNKDGDQSVSKAEVFLDFIPDLESFLMLGESVEADPLEVVDAYPTMAVEVIPDLRGLRQVITAWL